MNRRSAQRLLAVLSASLLALSLAACGGESDDGGDAGGSDDGGSAEVAAPGAAAAVCDGEANGSAPAYEEGAAQVSVFTDSGDGFALSPYVELPESSRALIPEEASVVVCMTVTDSKVVDMCEFEDDESGEKFTQELADATYEGRAIVASTGEALFTEIFEAKAGDCGILASFTPGEGTRTEYAKPQQELAKALKPYTG